MEKNFTGNIVWRNNMTDEELAIQLPKLKTKIPYDEDIFGKICDCLICQHN